MSYMARKRRTRSPRDSFLIKIWFLLQWGSKALVAPEINHLEDWESGWVSPLAPHQPPRPFAVLTSLPSWSCPSPGGTYPQRLRAPLPKTSFLLWAVSVAHNHCLPLCFLGRRKRSNSGKMAVLWTRVSQVSLCSSHWQCEATVGAESALSPLPSLSILGIRLKYAPCACSLLPHGSCKHGCTNPDTNASQI